jgi:pimeloyl-ACP methyl ester carboxylesterase
MPAATSKDGTDIVYEKSGNGSVIILVNGALAHRKFYGEKDLAALLDKDFAVIYYDRRGRGDSADIKPYTIEKEIDDIEALIDEAGGKAYLYGSSSGAALALLAAVKLGPQKIHRLALYEPPYNPDASKEDFAEEKKKINTLIASGKSGDAAAFFLEKRGTPPEVLEDMQKSQDWEKIKSVAHTLVYDFEILGDGKIPTHTVNSLTVSTLVMDGEKSFDFVHTTADALGKMIPGAVRKTLADQTHQVSPEILAPVLKEFFL